MDVWILISSFLSFILFIMFLPVIFRMIHAYDAPKWYLRFACMGSLVCLGLWEIHPVWLSGENQIVGILMSLCIYGLLVVLFLFGVFGVFEASITLHLLAKIALSGINGIHPNALLSRYNRISIVKRRIDRFLWSGELVPVGGQYRLSKRLSYFMVREYFLNLLRLVFPHP
jgi:hypothetical protein